MIPRTSQLEIAREGYKILREHMIVYLAMEERTGKTLTSILIAEFCKNIENVLVLTTKNALGKVNPKPHEEGGWLDTIDKYGPSVNIEATNYHKAKNVTMKPDLVILDEAHNYLSAIPKYKGPKLTYSAIWSAVKELTYGVPIIYSSATPHAQGYHQLFQQFKLSKWSPWKHENFYMWFKKYGEVSTIWVNGREVNQYTKSNSDLCEADVKHLFITKTRKELEFEYEPKDKIHYIDLDTKTKGLYNELLKDRVITIPGTDIDLIADTPMKMRTSLHMLEGGVAKISNCPEHVVKRMPKNIPHIAKIKDRETRSHDLYIVLQNNEKCRYMKQIFGDTEDLVIYYNYIAEKLKLEAYFKKARVLQATSHAEGIDLVDYKTIVVYSQDFKTAKHTQRRARQASKSRTEEIIVHFLLVQDAVSEQVYETVSKNKENFVDRVFERIEL